MKTNGFEFNRFDICEAYYLFASNYHGGQSSKEYAIFGRLDKMQFRPSPLLNSDGLNENAQMIYDGLVMAQEERRNHHENRTQNRQIK
jgi:hypothetical protein